MCNSLFCLTLFAGVPLSTQIRDLQRGCDVVVGTPGRIIDLIENSRALSLAEVCNWPLLGVQVILGFLHPVWKCLCMSSMPYIRTVLGTA